MAIFFDHRVQAPFPGSCHDCQWHKTHGLLAVASYNSTTAAAVTVYQEEGEPLLQSVVRKTKEATVLVWHPSKKVLAVGWETGEITVRNEQDNEAYEVSRLHKSEITVMQWTSNGSRLLSADSTGFLIIWKADLRGRIGQPIAQQVLDETLLQVILLPPPAVDPNFDVAALARAAVSGDESALDMFSWQKGKVNSKLAMAAIGPQESLTFFVGGNNGNVFYVDESGKVIQKFFAEGSIRKLLYYDLKNMLVTVTEHLMLTLHSVDRDGETMESVKVKLNGKPDKADIIWAGKGTLAISTGEKYVRMWDLEKDENYILGLKAYDFGDPSEIIMCIAYCSEKGILACGTSTGRVDLWKYSPSTSSASVQEPAEQWQSLSPSSVNGVVIEISFGSAKSLLAVNTIDNVYILTQQQTCSHCSNGVTVVQTGAMQLSVDNFTKGNAIHHELKTDIQVKGVCITNEALAIMDGRRVVVYKFTGGNPPFHVDGSFNTNTRFICLLEQNVYTAERGKILVHNFQGTVKQQIPLPDNQDEVVSLEICSLNLVVATASGAVKVFDLSRRDAKAAAGPRYFQSSINDFSRIVSAKCNAKTTRVSAIISKTDGKLDSRIHVWDIELDSFQFFNFATGFDDADDNVSSRLTMKGDADATVAERNKQQTAKEVSGRQPVSHFWDLEDARLLVCEARHEVDMQNSAERSSKESANDEIVDVIVVSLFVTSDHGFMVQNNFNLNPTCDRMFSLEIPFYYFVKKLDQAQASRMPNEYDKQPQSMMLTDSLSMVVRRTHPNFIGLEDTDKASKAAMMDFSFFLTLGDMDEAFKAIKIIKSGSVWENMAKMCVRTQRLDVARVCLGSMRNARAMMCLRQASKEAEVDARVAVLAIQLGLHDEAERLLKTCKRYDLLNEFYQSRCEWEKALAVAELYDRIHLRTTAYNYAKYMESQGNFAKAIEYYEKSNTHRFEVPRMLFEDPDNLEAYVANAKDKTIFKWWAQYMESSGELDVAMRYYEASQDYLSLVRVYCFKNEIQMASKVCNDTNDRAACYHVARQYENNEQFEHAIHFFTRAQAYGNAIRLCREHGHDDKLMNMALLGKPEDMVEAARYYESKPSQQEKAVMLYHKAGYFSKALELAFSTKQYAALHMVSESLNETTDPQLLQRCADFFIENSQYDRAVDLLAAARKYWDALKLCMDQHVPMTEELVEKLTPSKEVGDVEERNKILEGIGEVCMAQRQYHLATKKYTQCGNRVKAMKALLKSGDTEKIVFFANVSRQKEIYIMAGHYLQSLDWQRDPEIMKNIIGFYTKGRAIEPLAGFYDACAQVEIEEFRNYEKALGALGEAYKVLSKASDPIAQEQKLSDLKNRILITRKFLQIKSTFEMNTDEAARQCRALLNETNVDGAVRYGDVYGLMVEHYAHIQQWKAAYNCLEELRACVPRVNFTAYIDRHILEAVHRGVNVPFKENLVINDVRKNGYQSRTTGSDDENEGEVVDEEVLD